MIGQEETQADVPVVLLRCERTVALANEGGTTRADYNALRPSLMHMSKGRRAFFMP